MCVAPQLALKSELASLDEEGVASIRQHVTSGRFVPAHYIDLYTQRLREVGVQLVFQTPAETVAQEMVAERHDILFGELATGVRAEQVGENGAEWVGMAGGAETLVLALEMHGAGCEQTQLWGCRALQNLCDHGGVAVRKAVLLAEGGRALLDGVRAEGRPKVQTAALWALGALLEDGDSSVRSTLIQFGAVEPVTATLNSLPESEDVAIAGCRVLGLLSAGCSMDKRAVASKAVPILPRTIRAHLQSPELQVAGCAALWSMCCSGDNRATIVVEERVVPLGFKAGIEVAIGARRAHPEHPLVQSTSEGLLRALLVGLDLPLLLEHAVQLALAVGRSAPEALAELEVCGSAVLGLVAESTISYLLQLARLPLRKLYRYQALGAALRRRHSHPSFDARYRRSGRHM